MKPFVSRKTPAPQSTRQDIFQITWRRIWRRKTTTVLSRPGTGTTESASFHSLEPEPKHKPIESKTETQLPDPETKFDLKPEPESESEPEPEPTTMC